MHLFGDCKKSQYHAVMLVANGLNFVLQALRFVPTSNVFSLILHAQPSQVALVFQPFLVKSFQQLGYQILQPDTNRTVQADVVMGRLRGDALQTLQKLTERTKPGGHVLLATWKYQLPKTTLCAALLHAGLQEPKQVESGAMVITCGRKPVID